MYADTTTTRRVLTQNNIITAGDGESNPWEQKYEHVYPNNLGSQRPCNVMKKIFTLGDITRGVVLKNKTKMGTPRTQWHKANLV